MKTPWVALYCHDLLQSQRWLRMTSAQQAAYINLLCTQAVSGPLPADLEDLAFLAARNTRDLTEEAFLELWKPPLSDCFEEQDGGLVNPKMAEEVEKANQRSAAGRKAVEARWKRRKARSDTTVSTPVEPSKSEGFSITGQDMTGQDKREGAAAPSSARADLLSDACAELDAPGWVLPLLREYEAHRREKKAGKLTLRGWKAKVKDAVVHGEGPVRAAVRLSVSNGWTGLFPEKCAESANQGPSAGRQPRSLNQQQRNRLYAEAQRAFSDAGNGTAHSNSDLHRWLWVTGHPHAALLDPEAIDAP